MVFASQRTASDPKLSAWVSANAGSGKTHVLVERVIRLMLGGTDPSRILCLTFTKAAAAEMSERLFQRLSVWVARTDSQLASDLREMGVEITSKELLRTARRLFTRALETPGGLKIQTVHAFCERLLQLFPVEAGVVPGFTVMDDRASDEKLHEARDRVLHQARREPGGELARALSDIVARVQANGFDALLAEILTRRGALRSVFSDKDGIDSAIAILRQAMGLGPAENKQTVRSTLLPVTADYRRLISALGSGSKTDLSRSLQMEDMLNTSGDLRDLRKLFLTNENQPRKMSAIASKKVRDCNHWLETLIVQEQERLITAIGKLSDLEQVSATRSLLFLASKIETEFENAKRAGGLYDFNDLIFRTRELLQSRSDAAWVLYKLDGGLEHVLVDEAQDTSPSQWEIVQSLIAEFFSGQGARPTPDRTLFVVGDRKQSIYSFQGADPDVFEEVHEVFASLIGAAGQGFGEFSFTLSFRSTAEVLRAVDAVFHESRPARRGLDGARPSLLVHESCRMGQHGLVELWPLVEPGATEQRDTWTAPAGHLRVNSPRRKLARQIAQKIGSWIGRREIAALGRTVRSSDILILVRRRNSFFDALIRELRKAGIPVAGADRLDLLKSIAVLDFLALARFCTLPEDDYSLACVLKSPLIHRPLEEDELFEIAWNRGPTTLWKRLADSSNPECTSAHARIFSWLETAQKARPYEFFSEVLITCRKSILARLGSEANDALDAFLDQVLEYERTHSSSLIGFLQWFTSGGIEIKRNMEQTSSEVRIMTVHGAKGLEAPIVILPDTTDVPDRRQQASLMMVDAGGGAKLPFWRLPNTPVSETVSTWLSESDSAQANEYNRLLYVAMTRARDELYIAGYLGTKAIKPQCWYSLMAEALIPEMTEIGKDEGWRMGVGCSDDLTIWDSQRGANQIQD